MVLSRIKIERNTNYLTKNLYLPFLKFDLLLSLANNRVLNKKIQRLRKRTRTLSSTTKSWIFYKSLKANKGKDYCRVKVYVNKQIRVKGRNREKYTKNII
jgi:hypothetical protein